RIDVKHFPCPRLITDDQARALLSRVVVLKLNGGLGTSMGCTGPKSCVPVRGGDTFISLILEQLETLNKRYGVSVPLVFMNSYNTADDTRAEVAKCNRDVEVHYFNQAAFPRLCADTMLPLKDTDADKDDPAYYYPPGHGDCLRAFKESGLAEQFHSEGREWTFISNVDNLGATVDLPILQYLSTTEYDFMPELTPKTPLDVKGGTVVNYHGSLKLLELAQVPPEHVNEFKNIQRFDTFNTNNNYVRLSAL
ncbi:UTP--glucose-1-phosphate uridylyltransferase family protein, partial [Kipferlia bialata]